MAGRVQARAEAARPQRGAAPAVAEARPGRLAPEADGGSTTRTAQLLQRSAGNRAVQRALVQRDEAAATGEPAPAAAAAAATERILVLGMPSETLGLPLTSVNLGGSAVGASAAAQLHNISYTRRSDGLTPQLLGAAQSKAKLRQAMVFVRGPAGETTYQLSDAVLRHVSIASAGEGSESGELAFSAMVPKHTAAERGPDGGGGAAPESNAAAGTLTLEGREGTRTLPLLASSWGTSNVTGRDGATSFSDQDVSISKAVDDSSHALLQAFLGREAFSKATLDLAVSGGSAKVILQEAHISSHSSDGAVESVSFGFKELVTERREDEGGAAAPDDPHAAGRIKLSGAGRDDELPVTSYSFGRAASDRPAGDGADGPRTTIHVFLPLTAATMRFVQDARHGTELGKLALDVGAGTSYEMESTTVTSASIGNDSVSLGFEGSKLQDRQEEVPGQDPALAEGGGPELEVTIDDQVHVIRTATFSIGGSDAAAGSPGSEERHAIRTASFTKGSDALTPVLLRAVRDGRGLGDAKVRVAGDHPVTYTLRGARLEDIQTGSSGKGHGTDAGTLAFDGVDIEGGGGPAAEAAPPPATTGAAVLSLQGGDPLLPIAAESYAWGMARPVGPEGPSALSVQDISLTKARDAQSTVLLKALRDGRTFSKAALQVKVDGGHIDVALEEAKISSLEQSAEGETLSISFAEKVLSTVLDGQAEAPPADAGAGTMTIAGVAGGAPIPVAAASTSTSGDDAVDAAGRPLTDLVVTLPLGRPATELLGAIDRSSAFGRLEVVLDGTTYGLSDVRVSSHQISGATASIGFTGSALDADGKDLPLPPKQGEKLRKTMRRWMKTGQEADLQAMLNEHSGVGLAVDGIFGPKTQQAVYDFQKEQGLDVDGVVGRKTWRELQLALGQTPAD